MQLITHATDGAGLGPLNFILRNLPVNPHQYFSSEPEKYARKAYAANWLTPEDRPITKMASWQSFKTLQSTERRKYLPEDLAQRDIPKDPLDLYLAVNIWNKKHESYSHKKNTDFYQVKRFIKKNRPRFFILEGPKELQAAGGLIPGQELGYELNSMLGALGGKTVNGVPVLFPKDRKPAKYHVYSTILNSAEHGAPVHRTRLYIVGIRDNKDNFITWPKPRPDYFLRNAKRMRQVCSSRPEKKELQLAIKRAQSLIMPYAKDEVRRSYRFVKIRSKNGYFLAQEFDTVKFNSSRICSKKSAQSCLDLSGADDIYILRFLREGNVPYLARLSNQELLELLFIPKNTKLPVSRYQALKILQRLPDINIMQQLIVKLFNIDHVNI